jgi:hypothetical protein
MFQLDKIPAETFAMLELRQDPLFRYMDSADYSGYVEKSIQTGHKKAQQYIGKNLENEIETAGFGIVSDNRLPAYQITSYRIQARTSYNEKSGLIFLYMNEINYKWNIMQEYGYNVTLEWLIKLVLAHEFYHVTEFLQGCTTGDMMPPVYRKTLFGNKKASLRSVSEIAAHNFSKTYMESVIQPEMTDYLVLLHDGTITSEYLEKLVDLNNGDTEGK